MLLLAFTIPISAFAGVAILIAYPVVFFIIVPRYADAWYYDRIRRTLAQLADGGKPSSPTKPVSAAVVGLASILLPALVLIAFQASHVDYRPRSEVSEAIALMGGAKTPIAEHFADKGRWPDDLKQVAANTSGKFTDRVEITSGAGAATGAFVMMATMRKDGVRGEVAGKTVQMRSEDGGRTWVCSRGAENGVETRYLPAACR
jgi:type IV pilus assembly protein PilA